MQTFHCVNYFILNYKLSGTSKNGFYFVKSLFYGLGDGFFCGLHILLFFVANNLRNLSACCGIRVPPSFSTSADKNPRFE
jgi:hypothetical protein